MGFFSDMEESYAQPEPEGRDEDQQEAVDEALDQLEAKHVQEAKAVIAEDKALAEVDVRIRKANFYRLILDNPLFDNGDAVAAEVEKEFRTFATGRLRVLMGMETEVKPQAREKTFGPDEEKVLRMLAAKILKKPALMQAELPKQTKPLPSKPALAEPTLKPVAQTQTAQPRLNQVTTPVRRGAGRPPGTGKNQVAAKVAAKLPEDVQTDENGRQFVMVERGTDDKGNARFVKVDVTPPVRAEGLKPAPMPSQEQAMMMEIIKADQVPKSGKLNEIIGKVQE